MGKSNGMNLETAAKTCRKYGIKTFKCQDFEFELGFREGLLPVVADKIESVVTEKAIDPKIIFADMPSDEEMMFAHTEGFPEKEKK